MSEDNNMIDVRIEERVLHLDSVNTEQALFTHRTGFGYVMPRSVWNAKGRPGQVKISAEVMF